jgi:phage tail sheath protein FI
VPGSWWKYVSVRRLFIDLESSIEEGTQWAVSEPDDERSRQFTPFPANAHEEND